MTVPIPEGERIRGVEEQVRGVRDEIRELKDELTRTRERLHRLETTTAALVQDGRRQAQTEQTARRRLELRLQTLTLLVGVGSILVPVVALVLR